MATFNYTVDTKPMAEEMKSVSRHVTATTGAVVAMQTAVVIAEERAANHVCNNVNKGFYSLIRSQISQKMAKLQSEVDAHLMQLLQQKNALLGIKNRMQKDYNMISSRYIKLFNGLNSNLKQRIFELDKPTIDFAVKEVDKTANRTKYLTATVPVAQLESLGASQRIVSSNVKFRGANVIKSMYGFLKEMSEQKKLTDQILINDGRFTATAQLYAPIVILECNRGKSEPTFEITAPHRELDSSCVSAIKNASFENLLGVTWSSPKGVHTEVANEFNKLVASSGKSQRINDLALRLFQSTAIQTL
jgi:hypothetical protein